MSKAVETSRIFDITLFSTPIPSFDTRKSAILMNSTDDHVTLIPTSVKVSVSIEIVEARLSTKVTSIIPSISPTMPP